MNTNANQRSNSDEPIDDLLEAVRSGDLGRRDFLRRAVTAGVSSAVAYSLLGQASASAQNRYAQNATTQAFGEETQSLPNPPTSTAQGEEQSPPTYTTTRVGEEGQPSYSYGEGPPETTRAVGEEGPPPTYTTQSFGEEQPPTPPPTYTTQAFGEEQPPTPPPTYTTQAFGEEQLPQRDCDRRRATTQALGEESTAPSLPYAETPPNFLRPGGQESFGPPTTTPPRTSNPPRATTQAIGEETSGGQPGRRSPSPRGQIESTIRNQIPKVWKSFGRW